MVFLRGKTCEANKKAPSLTRDEASAPWFHPNSPGMHLHILEPLLTGNVRQAVTVRRALQGGNGFPCRTWDAFSRRILLCPSARREPRPCHRFTGLYIVV